MPLQIIGKTRHRQTEANKLPRDHGISRCQTMYFFRAKVFPNDKKLTHGDWIELSVSSLLRAELGRATDDEKCCTLAYYKTPTYFLFFFLS